MRESRPSRKVVAVIVCVPLLAIAIAVVLLLPSHHVSTSKPTARKPSVVVQKKEPPFYLDAKPQTLVVFGLDHRYGEAGGVMPRTDTIILIHIDPKRGVSLLSIPRDLRVNIPGHGYERINAAYSYGGPALSLRVINELTGLHVTEYAATQFGTFTYALDKLGCPYVDIDRRYYHSNAGVPAASQYTEVNVAAGYQKLCGEETLSYLRQREEDSDITREARQQAFLIQLRQQFTLASLEQRWSGLLQIFRKYVTTNMNDSQLIETAKAVLDSREAPAYQVRFPYSFEEAYVNVAMPAIRAAAKELVRPPPPPSDTLTRVERCPRPSGNATEYPSGSAQRLSSRVHFPAYYPSRLFASSQPMETRVYKIRGADGKTYSAYRIVVNADQLGQYYGIQGTSWSSPPLLNPPFQKWTARGRSYQVYTNGSEIRTIAWKTPSGSYWVMNSLQQALSPQEMWGVVCGLVSAN